jgi:hypothetical protein
LRIGNAAECNPGYMNTENWTFSTLISGIRRDVHEICALLGYYAVSCGNCLPTFRHNVSVPSSRVKSPSWSIFLSPEMPKRTSDFLYNIMHCYTLAIVYLSVRMEPLGSHWTDFHKIWYLSIFRKFVEIIQVSLKSDKNNGYFTWRPMYIYDNISLILLRIIWDKVEKKPKHTFYVQ